MLIAQTLQELRRRSAFFAESPLFSQEWGQIFCQRNACELLLTYQDLLRQHHTALDIGCGEGRITSWLSEWMPDGSILGIDNNSVNIERALKTFGNRANLKFLVADATQLQLSEKFDWIMAFNSLHWLDEDAQKSFLKAAKNHLSKDGHLLFTLGLRHEPIWTAIEKTLTLDRWQQFFCHYQNPRAFYTEESYARLLQDLGYTLENIKTNKISYFFYDQKHFQNCVLTWLPQSECIPKEFKEDFLNDIAECYRNFLPSKNSVIEVIFSNLEVLAKKTIR